jgi:hypothetical protein
MGKGDKRGVVQRPDGEFITYLETSVTIKQPEIINLTF